MTPRRHAHEDERPVRPLTVDEQTEGLGLFAHVSNRDNPPFLAAPMTPIEHAFQAFHAENPHIYTALEAAALRQRDNGARRIGIAKLVEDIRYQPGIQTIGNEFKLNNNFRALYARVLIHRHPELEALFVLRERRESGAPSDQKASA